ncbi:MAG: uracil-DNA glycosylase [Candidatus Bathyarchaeota archaeon]
MRDIEKSIIRCRRCALWRGRKKAVPGEGNINSPVVLVGEAPGRMEDLVGKPFVGQAGNILEEILDKWGLGRKGIYITNLVKCRPPKNRRPRTDEISECSCYLDEQLGLIKPRVVAPMGNSALRYFFKRYRLGHRTIGEVHGRAFPASFEWSDGWLFPLYHPAAALYNRGLRETLVTDLGEMISLISQTS